MSASKRTKKKKMTLKVSHKKPRDPVAKEVKKRRAGPMKDRRKEADPIEEYDPPESDDYDKEGKVW